MQRIVVTGAAGLVGQNLSVLLAEAGHTNIVAIDKNTANLELLRRLNASIQVVNADLAEPGSWQDLLAEADVVVLLHAQIGGKRVEPFQRNNLRATSNVLQAIQRCGVPFTVHELVCRELGRRRQLHQHEEGAGEAVPR